MDGGDGKRNASFAFAPMNENPVSAEERAEWDPGHVQTFWRREKSLASVEIRKQSHPWSEIKNVTSEQ